MGEPEGVSKFVTQTADPPVYGTADICATQINDACTDKTFEICPAHDRQSGTADA